MVSYLHNRVLFNYIGVNGKSLRLTIFIKSVHVNRIKLGTNKFFHKGRTSSLTVVQYGTIAVAFI